MSKKTENYQAMSYNSSFTGQQADAALQKAAVIQMDGEGTQFLSNDGTYKEAGDKTNVLILSLENDLANGQKDSPVTAEVSASLVDAVTTGKACVIKSANSDILVNLQQIGNNVTIIMEQISRVGQTFVAVNTSITVNTSTNVIADYQTGALVLETSGDGTKFLSDDGKYKAVSSGDNLISQSDQNAILDAINSITNSELTSGGTLSEEKYNAIVLATPEAIKTLGGSSNGVYIRYDKFGQSTPTSGMVALSGIYTYNDGAISFMSRDLYTGLYLGVMGYNSAQFANLSITSSRQISYSLKNIQFDSSSDGTKFLSDDGTYKTVSLQPMKVLTESEYAALGTTPETDGVLYFVTPD